VPRHQSKNRSQWRKRSFVADLPRRSETAELNRAADRGGVDCRRDRQHTLLPLDDCLYALQPTIAHLTRSSLHRCLKRHGIPRPPQVENESAEKRMLTAW
jgi:hypothetical protein